MGRATKAVTVLGLAVAVTGIAASAASTSGVTGSSGRQIVQGTQNAAAYEASSAAVTTNDFVTARAVSCYTPEVPTTDMTSCNGAATTGENTAATAEQLADSNPGYPADGPKRVTEHSESDIRVDPNDPMHVVGTSKWFVSGPGYNHQLGFYETKDGGATWTQGHIPGYEGWTDDTDPVGAFDKYGNFWVFNLAYQFFYDKNGGHNFTVGKSQEPNPVLPAEVVGVSLRRHNASGPSDWVSPDIVAAYDSVGNEPDKQWIAIDTSRSPNRIYLMWVDFHFVTPVPYVSYADILDANGTHTPWSTPQKLPQPPHHPQGSTYLLPHVAPNGDVYTTVTNFNPAHQYGAGATIFVDKSTDGGATWTTLPGTISIPSTPPLEYANTTFRDGIENTFAVGPLANGHYPLYVAYEDYSAGVGNVLLTASYDGGVTWTDPIQVNDNESPPTAPLVDEFQPNLSVASNGTVSVAWYDRRLACPTVGTAEATAAGITTTSDPGASGASNYCVNASVQFYHANLSPFTTAPYDHNIRLSQHTWDPQLNAPHPGCATCELTFIGDYFGNDASVGSTDWFTSVSTFNGGTNPQHHQQQVVAKLATP
jgi:hypothetical protein